MCLSAATYGEAPRSTEFQGITTTSRNTDPTKKMAIRATTEFIARAMARSGSRLSAAAMVTTSAPVIEKITTTMALKTAPTPLGKNPPCEVRLEKYRWWPGNSPNAKARTSTGNPTIVATLIPANQNSNSPNDETENRLVAVIIAIRHKQITHNGACTQ